MKGMKTPPEWGTAHFVCPKCQVGFTLDDLNQDVDETDSFQCPSCHVSFRVRYRYFWAYILIALIAGIIIAYVRGHHSIIFVVAALCYSVLAMIALQFCAFALKLPKRFELREDSVQTLHISQE